MNSFEIIAGVASILGLVFSFLAFIQAKRASAAAEEARNGIILRTLADELEIACVKIDQLSGYALEDRLGEATILAQEVTSALSEIPYRRSPYLSEERRNELLTAGEEVRAIHRLIAAARDQVPTRVRKQRLMQQCQNISVTLRKNLGKIKGEIERGPTE